MGEMYLLCSLSFLHSPPFFPSFFLSFFLNRKNGHRVIDRCTSPPFDMYLWPSCALSAPECHWTAAFPTGRTRHSIGFGNLKSPLVSPFPTTVAPVQVAEPVPTLTRFGNLKSAQVAKPVPTLTRFGNLKSAQVAEPVPTLTRFGNLKSVQVAEPVPTHNTVRQPKIAARLAVSPHGCAGLGCRTRSDPQYGSATWNRGSFRRFWLPSPLNFLL